MKNALSIQKVFQSLMGQNLFSSNRRNQIAAAALSLGTSLCFSSVGHAMIVTAVEGASQPVNVQLAPVTIYGGLAGVPGSNGRGTSDSCAKLTSNYAPCNPRRVDAGTVLIIHTYTSAQTVGVPRLFYISGGSAVPETAIAIDSSNPTAAGAGESFLAVKWGDICAALGDASLSSQCIHSGTSAIQGTFRIGYVANINDTHLPTDDTIDVKIVLSGYTGTNSNLTDSFASDCGDAKYNQFGVCAFEMDAGSSEATLSKVFTDSGITGPALQFSGLRVLYAKTDLKKPDYSLVTAHSEHQDFSFLTDSYGNVSISGDGRVMGLARNQAYVFKVAMIDLAGNIGLYTANTTNSAAGDGDTFCPDGFAALCHVAVPK